MKLKFIDSVLGLSGDPDYCRLFADSYSCSVLPPAAEAAPQFRLHMVRGRPEQLDPQIPDWARAEVDLPQLTGFSEETYTHHVFDGARLFVCTRAREGTVATLFSEDLESFRMTVFREMSAYGLTKIRRDLLPFVMRFVGDCAGYILCHCAAVADETGRTALFLAHAGTGKTTLSIAMTRRGYRLLNDDLAYVGGSSGREVHGVYEEVNFTEWTAEQFPECAAFFSAAGVDLAGHKQPVDIRKIYGEQAVGDHGRAALIFVLRRDPNVPLGIRCLSRQEQLRHLFVSQICPIASKQWQTVLELLSAARMVELNVGPDPAAAAEHIQAEWDRLMQPAPADGLSS